MKNIYKLTWIFLLTFSTITAQEQRGIVGSNNWLRNWTEFNPKNVNYSESTHILAGDITEDLTLSKRNTYLLEGNVFVTNGAMLSIEPGTVIMGDTKTNASLTIAKGAAIIAEGTETDPIVFTSNASYKKAGDWGGLIILGDAPTNKLGNNSASSFYTNIDVSNMVNTTFGGENSTSNSGVLKYVRVEYAGKKANRNIPSNAILLAGIGSKTEINHVMVSYASGNSFNVIGGVVDMHSMISYKSKGNDYEFNYGAKSNIHNSLAVRSPYMSDRNGSRCLLVRSYNKEGDVDFSKAGTNVFAKNVTLLTHTKSLESDIKMGLVKEAIYIGNNSQIEVSNSVISGFKLAIMIDEKTKIVDENLTKLRFNNMYFNNCEGKISSEFNSNNETLISWYDNPVFSNEYAQISNDETFIKLDPAKPDYRLRSNTVLAMNKK